MSREELIVRIATADTGTLARVTAALQDPQAGAEANVKLHTLTEAAQRLNIGRTSLYRMIADGSLKTVQIRPGCRRVPASELVRIAKGGAA